MRILARIARVLPELTCLDMSFLFTHILFKYSLALDKFHKVNEVEQFAMRDSAQNR